MLASISSGAAFLARTMSLAMKNSFNPVKDFKCYLGAVWVSTLSLTACTPLATVNPDGTTSHHYFGYVKVVVPQGYSSEGQIHSVDVTSIGLQVRDGVGVGYFRDNRITVPLDCRLVVLVRNQEQLDKTIDFLKTKGADNLCTSIYRE